MFRRALTALVVAASLVAVPATAASAAPAPTATVGTTLHAAAPKACKATVSVRYPKQYTRTTVSVSRVAKGAKVTVKAHYKTTTNTKTAKAGSKGTASVVYPVSGATPNRKVPVTITAKLGTTTWSCSTWYTPRHR